MVDSPVYKMRDSLAELSGLAGNTAGLPAEVAQSLYPEIFTPALLKLDSYMPPQIVSYEDAQRFAIAIVADLLFDSLASTVPHPDGSFQHSEALISLTAFTENEMVTALEQMLVEASFKLDGPVQQSQNTMNAYTYYVTLMRQASPESRFWSKPGFIDTVIACLWSLTGAELIQGRGVTKLQNQLRGTTKNMIQEHENCARSNALLYLMAVQP